ncbi:hypothetical protein DYB34_007658 [Aphanomyces astaci]|uniref:Uncharacterized protein n=2 Tax=Aphanomyces astaci TaxID=112090 RepID=A0A3R6VLN8_APHAT|nr:hypothetical protein DYB34_007658 [Aphanomyces astaci]
MSNAAPSNETLVYGGSVYVHKYDAATQGYIPLSESALGLALMGGSTSYRLFCYNRAQAEVFTTPLGVHVKFTPQQDHYVNFYDASGTDNYSMRFKDDAQVQAFLQAVACIKLSLVSRGSISATHDDIHPGDGGYAVQLGDIVGIKIQAWAFDTAVDSSSSTNPIDIVASPPVMRYLDVDDLLKVKLGDSTTEGLVGLSGQVVGMQKGSVRYIYLPSSPSTTWILAHAELVKVKKDKRPNSAAVASAPVISLPPTGSEDDELKRDDLVTRMAHLSRVGSGHAALPTAASLRSSHPNVPHQPTQAAADKVATPIVLTMPQSPSPPPLHSHPSSSLASSFPSSMLPQSEAALPPNSSTSLQPPPTTEADQSSLALRQEQQRLLAEQEDIQRQRQALTRQQQIQSPPLSKARPPTTPPSPSPLFPPPTSLLPPSPPTLDAYYSASSVTSANYLQQQNHHHHVAAPLTSSSSTGGFNLVPFVPATPLPPPQAYATTSTSAPSASGALFTPSNVEMDATLQRVHRTTLAMEGMLIDLQRKMDRVIVPSSYSSGGGGGGSAYSRRPDQSTTASLLKSMERALNDLDGLHDANHRLTSQVTDLQRHNRQLEDDVDRLQADLRRHTAASSSYSQVQAALDHAKQRCAQMEADVERWTAAVEAERRQRMQLERDLATQRLSSAQQSADGVVAAQVDEARQVATMAQKQMQAEKLKHDAAAAKMAADVEALQTTYESRRMDILRTQMAAERASHVEDAEAVKVHVEALMQERDVNRAKVAATERAAADMEDRWRREKEDAAAARDARADLFKELMNDIYFACQDAFDEDAEFTGKEIAIQIRKILKQHTNDVVAKFEK